MIVPLVSAAFFFGNIDKTRLFLHEHGYMKEMISKSRLDHCPHAVDVLCSGSNMLSRSRGFIHPGLTRRGYK